MKKFFVVFSLAILSATGTWAQTGRTDAERENLKGNVRSVLTTTKGSHGQQVGNPCRYDFNQAGNFSRTIYYDTIGTPTIIINYFYDRKGCLYHETRTREPFSELLAEVSYTYDKKNHCLTGEIFGVADSMLYRVVSEYDKNGNLLKETTFDEQDSVASLNRFTIDQHGNRTETLMLSANDRYSGQETFRYDTDGNMIERRVYHMNKLRQCFLYTYLYDSKGNWVSCMVIHVTPNDAEIYETIIREISYFD